MRYRFYTTADVFTDEIFGGNPLAVFPEAEGLDGGRMQRIAREFNLSEMAFVCPPSGSAAAALAGYLGEAEPRAGTLRWVVEQGLEMGRPSILEVEADRAQQAITAVHLGGASVLVSEGVMEVPEA